MVWADEDYGYKKKITLNHAEIDGDETDFPVLISVTDADLKDEANGGHVKSANGYDIIFYNDDEDTLLKHEIEYYLNTNGQLVYWVKVPSLSSSAPSTYIYMYYGKAGVGADPSTTDTWDSDFMAVWHLDGSPTGTQADSTSHGNDAGFVNVGVDNTQAWKIDDCIEFNGGGDKYVTGEDSSLTFSTYIYITCWLRVDEFHDYEEYWGKGGDLWFLTRENGAGGRFVWYSAAGTKYYATTIAQEFADATWYHIGFRVEGGGNISIFVDGSEVAGVGTMVSVPDSDPDIWEIGEGAGASREPEGRLDELRYSDVDRSDNWISTSFNNQDDPGTFHTFGAEEENPTEAGADIFYWDGTAKHELVKDNTSPVRMFNGTENIGLKLVAVDDANASPWHVFNGSAIKALKKKA